MSVSHADSQRVKMNDNLRVGLTNQLSFSVVLYVTRASCP